MGSHYTASPVIGLVDPDKEGELRTYVTEFGFEFLLVQSFQKIASYLERIQPKLVIVDCQHTDFSIDGFQYFFEKYPDSRNVSFLLLAGPEEQALEIEEKVYRNVEITHLSGQGLEEKVRSHLQPSVVITFWGVRGSIPSANRENMVYGGNTTCLQIESPLQNQLLIFDSGTGIRNLGNEIANYHNNRASGHIFLTHPHWDHIQGFPFFKPLYQPENRFIIHMPEQYKGGTREVLSGHMTKTFFPVTLEMFAADIEYVTQEEERVEYEGFDLEYMVANHPTKTAIYKIYIGDYVIVFAPDNELGEEPSPLRFIQKFESFVSEADLLIHDAQYNRDTYKSRKGWGHSAWEDVVEISRNAGVKRLYLTHHDPDSTDEYLEKIDDRLQAYNGSPFQEIEMAKEKMVVKLPLVDQKV